MEHYRYPDGYDELIDVWVVFCCSMRAGYKKPGSGIPLSLPASVSFVPIVAVKTNIHAPVFPLGFASSPQPTDRVNSVIQCSSR